MRLYSRINIMPLSRVSKKLLSASLLFDMFMKDVMIGFLQINMIYEGQSTSASILSM